LLNIGAWFVCGRVIFSVGYVAGTAIGLPQLRGYGFALTLFCNLFILEQIFFGKSYSSALPLQL
jgi:hypothetical protein